MDNTPPDPRLVSLLRRIAPVVEGHACSVVLRDWHEGCEELVGTAYPGRLEDAVELTTGYRVVMGEEPVEEAVERVELEEWAHCSWDEAEEFRIDDAAFVRLGNLEDILEAASDE